MSVSAAGAPITGASLASVTVTSKVATVSLTPSLAVTSTETGVPASKSRATPSARRRVASSTTKRGSLTEKVRLPSSGSKAPSVPITAPSAFSATVPPTRIRSCGASSTSATATDRVAVVLAPAASVAVTSTETVEFASKSRDWPGFSRSSSPTTSNGEPASTEKVIAASSPSGSTADSVPMVAPSTFSLTAPPVRTGASGARFGVTTRVRVTLSVRRSSPSALPVSESTVFSST